MSAALLCVGGPADGLRIASVCDRIRVPELGGWGFSAEGHTPAVFSAVGYRQESLFTPDGTVLVWVPEKQTAFETIKKLIEGYHHG